MNSKILKNTSAYMLAGMLPNFVNLVMIPIYTRFLDPADYGIVSLVTSFTTVVMVFMGLQMGNSLERLYFDHEGKKSLRDFFSTVLIGIVVLSLVVILPVHFFGPALSTRLFPKVELPYDPFILLGMTTVFFRNLANYFNLMLRVQERAQTLLINAAVNIAIGVGGGIYFVIISGMGATGVLLSQAISAVCHAAVLAIALRKYIRPRFRMSMLKPALAYSLPLVPHALGGIVFIYSDRYILSFFTTLTAIGLYDLADKIALVLRVIIGSFNGATLPEFMRKSRADMNDAREFYRGIMTKWSIVMAFLFLGMSLFAEELIIWFLPEKYAGAYIFVPILLAAYVFRGLYGFPANSVIFMKKTFVIPLITVAAGIANIVANILLIPIFGIIAAAWTTLISYMITFLIALHFSNRYYRLLYDWKATIPYYLASLTLVVLFYLWPEHSMLKFSIEVLAIVLFAAVVWIANAGGIRKEICAALGKKTVTPPGGNDPDAATS